MIPGLAIVAIGRNEGERLERCLRSALRDAGLVVYVDSGSTDGSVALAEGLGVQVVKLDMSVPFTAARARNAGYRAALQADPDLRYIQFVDGDCELVAGWLAEAAAFLDGAPKVGAVTGRRRERFPERSPYNELCDMEWAVRPGASNYFGGDVMIRTSALVGAGGYRDSLIAGEEPELALRMRRLGWAIHVLDRDITLHDANMLRFRQWWLRMKRSGYAYAEGAWLHGAGPERHWVWRSLQAWLWVPGPLLMMVLAVWAFGLSGFLVLGIYPAQFVRLFAKSDLTGRRRVLSALSNTLVRFPEFAGQLHYLGSLACGGGASLIEYK
ncbi:MAG: glycosyltransferase family 2 protein [Pseudomonadales bacterium]|nr:glycosyltransferase family 2 protein [Pseudomonadales bacterium]